MGDDEDKLAVWRMRRGRVGKGSFENTHNNGQMRDTFKQEMFKDINCYDILYIFVCPMEFALRVSSGICEWLRNGDLLNEMAARKEKPEERESPNTF